MLPGSGPAIDTLIMDRGQPMGYGYTNDEPTLVYTDPLQSRRRSGSGQRAWCTTVVDAAAGRQRL